MQFCTIVAANYLPYARVLAASLKEHHEGAELTVLVVDLTPEQRPQDEPMQIVTTDDLPLSAEDVRQMATMYDVTEFATALKPWLLELLTQREDGTVTYLDPDIRVYASLHVVEEALGSTGLVLTPHTTQPMPRDGLHPDEQDILLSGTYNLGFVAVDRRALPFLRWWQERLRWDCLHDVKAGLFVDQRWVDLAVHYFPFTALRDEGCNVAYWNVDQRPLRNAGGSWVLATGPLRFFHFSGYRPENPQVLSRHHVAAARLDPTSTQALAELCLDYSQALKKAGYEAGKIGRYAFAASSDGVLLTRRLRRRYRRDLLAGKRPPDAFASGRGRAFRAWARHMGRPQERLAARVPTWARSLEKAATQPGHAFRVARARLLGMLISVRPARRVPGAGAPLGANVIGYFQAEDGVGHGARALAASLTEAGIPHSVVVERATPSSQQFGYPEDASAPTHSVDVVCVNADMFSSVMAPRIARQGRAAYTVGVWAWEVGTFPESMRKSAQLVDEVWTLSQHAAAAIAPVIDKPVLVFPYPVVAPPAEPLPRAQLGLPEGFLFLFCFDARSVVARKNPGATVRAFCSAFAEGEGPQLVIKVLNGDKQDPDLSALYEAARSDVHVLDEHLSPAEQSALMATADCYVSLHRAEGLGLTMAEAMACSVPVIATGYSGNLEFMNIANSFLVPYELVPVPVGCEPYPIGTLWAEPDVAAAAACMRQVVEDPAEAKARAIRARADIERTMRPAARTAFLRARMAHIARVTSAAP